MTFQPPPEPYFPGQQFPGGPPPGQQPPSYGPPSQYQPYPAGLNGPRLPYSGRATGKQLINATWALLKQDRELLWIPAISSGCAILAALILFVPGYALGWAVSGKQASVGGWVGGVVAAFAVSVIGIYFQSALVIAANQRAEGGDPSLKGALAATWQHRGRILSWALVSTTVGVAIRALEQRFGAIGKILGLLAGIGWAIASFLVVPIVISEDLGPIAALKRSAELIKQTWGTGVRGALRFGLIQLALLLPILAVGVVGVLMLAKGDDNGIQAIGVVLIVVAALALIALGMVFNAITTYARALLYRYATGRPVPGLDPVLFAGAFAPKRGRRAGGFA